ncbi:MAG: hypothetical protein Q4F05_11835 [bacterium]|nr:hypothetical protein [bacterium]
MEIMKCGHHTMRDMRIDYPYIEGTFGDGKRKRYNVIDNYVPRRKEYADLKERNFFEKAYIEHSIVVKWNDDIDMLCDVIYENGEEETILHSSTKELGDTRGNQPPKHRKST